MASDAAPRLRGLYAITPELRDTDELVARVEASLRGGARVVQYRAKALAAGAMLEQARRLAKACAARGVPLVVNDSIELALACGAAGVHLGRDDPDPAAARRAFPRGLVGISCYDDIGRARDAAAAGADYVAVGSLFASGTKPAAVRAGLDLIGRARAASHLPVVAIGGITADNAPLAIGAGADMVAVIAAVFEADDVERAARAIAELFGEPLPGAPDVRAQPRTV